MSYLFSNIKRLCALVLVIGTALICSHASATSDCDNYVKLFVDSTGKVTEATLVNDIDRMIEQQVTEICESLTDIDPRFRNEWILVPFSYEDLSEDGYTTITKDMIDVSKAEIIYKSCYIGNIPKFPGGDVALMKCELIRDGKELLLKGYKDCQHLYKMEDEIRALYPQYIEELQKRDKESSWAMHCAFRFVYGKYFEDSVLVNPERLFREWFGLEIFD